MNKLKEEEKVHRVLEIIASYPGLSQRDVASHSGLSLGLVNLIVKRLIRTGHIKMSGLNSRKVQYILTPKGLVAKAKRTYLYMMSTVRTFFEYQRRMEQLISELTAGKSAFRFAIAGDGDIVPLLEMALRSSGKRVPYRILNEGEPPREDETLLDCRLNGHGRACGVSVLNRLLGLPMQGQGENGLRYGSRLRERHRRDPLKDKVVLARDSDPPGRNA